MNTKTTLAVLVLAVVLSIIGIMKFRGGASTTSGTADAEAGRPLLDPTGFSPSKVNAIDIARPADDERFRFERGENDIWRQTVPLPFDMEGWQIEGLASDAADLKIYQTLGVKDLVGDLTAEKLSLSPPAAVLVYESEEGEKTTIELGRIFVAGKAYARLDSAGDIFVVDDTLHKRVLERDPREWRVRTLFSGRDADPAEITVTDHETGAKLAITRVDARWRMISPTSTHLDGQAVDRFVNSVQSASVRGWVKDQPESLAIYGLDVPIRTLSMRIDAVQADGSVQSNSQTLHIGSPIDLADKSRYARHADRSPVFTISGAVADQLNPKPETLISKTILAAAPTDIKALTVKGQGGSFRLERTSEGWSIRKEGREEQSADKDLANALVNLLTSPRETVSLGSLPADGPDAAMAEIAVEDFNGSPLGSVLVSQKKSAPEAPSTDPASVTTIYDDRAGVLRSDSSDTLPALNPDAYIPEESAADDEIPKAEPSK